MTENVDDYIEKQQSPQREICSKLRDMILNTYPSITEQMKYGVPYYNDKYYIVALKDHVNLGVSIKNLSKEEISLFEGSGKLSRHIKVKSLKEIDEKRIIKMLDLVNRKK